MRYTQWALAALALFITSVIGGGVGGYVMLKTQQALFAELVESPPGGNDFSEPTVQRVRGTGGVKVPAHKMR